MRNLVLLAGLLALTACKTERSSPQAGATPSAMATTHSATVGDPLASVQAKLPKDGAKLVDLELARVALEERKGASPTFSLVKPRGWEESTDFSGKSFKPKGLGWRTSLSVESDCDGACIAKDWGSHIDAMLEKNYPAATSHVEVGPDGRRLRWQIVDGKQAWFRAAWFTPGASRYYSCSGTLDDPKLLPYLDAFLEICRTARVEK